MGEVFNAARHRERRRNDAFYYPRSYNRSQKGRSLQQGYDLDPPDIKIDVTGDAVRSLLYT